MVVVGAIVLIGVVTAVSLWRAKTEQSNRKAAEEMTAKWEAQIDSLREVNDSLRDVNHRLQSTIDSLTLPR